MSSGVRQAGLQGHPRTGAQPACVQLPALFRLLPSAEKGPHRVPSARRHHPPSRVPGTRGFQCKHWEHPRPSGPAGHPVSALLQLWAGDTRWLRGSAGSRPSAGEKSPSRPTARSHTLQDPVHGSQSALRARILQRPHPGPRLSLCPHDTRATTSCVCAHCPSPPRPSSSRLLPGLWSAVDTTAVSGMSCFVCQVSPWL